MFEHLKNKSGIALFLVLWVLVLLSVIVGEFCHAMRTEVNITRNFKEMTESYYIAEAGLNRAVMELIKNGGKPFITSVEDQDAEANDKIRWRVNFEIPPISYAGGQFEIQIQNEYGKINLNRADRALLRVMLGRFDLEDTEKDVIVDSILDWRDEDDLHRINGAEKDYYLSLPNPYQCKNGDFDSIKELLLVRGVTSEIYYGGLKDMITVYPDTPSGEKGVNAKKIQSRVNINSMPSQLLLSFPGMTNDLVQGLMEYRKEKDVTSMADLVSILGGEVYQAVTPFITLETVPYYTIKSMGSIQGSRVKCGIQVLVKIDPKMEKRYNILQWIDRIE
jgi:general secretion pathway protein K